MTVAARGLSRAEWTTTGVAFAVSAGLYLAHGHPYLARGVLGDLGGLAFLSLVVLGRHRRLRHEALFCLGCVAAVHLVRSDWPVAVAGVWWWGSVVVALGGYVRLRHRVLGRVAVA